MLSQTTGHLACLSSYDLTADGPTIVTATDHITCPEHANTQLMLCHNNPIVNSFTIYLKVGWSSQNVPMNPTIHHMTTTTTQLASSPPLPSTPKVTWQISLLLIGSAVHLHRQSYVQGGLSSCSSSVTLPIKPEYISTPSKSQPMLPTPIQ